jgi:tRNA threonylcarbamoyladenosine modification (KEOPS) complex Cgi121 subunit
MMNLSPLMLHEVRLEQSPQTIGIFGCTLAARITAADLLKHSRDVAAHFNVTLQLADASYVAGPSHLLIAAMHALRAFQRGTKRADVLGTEILRFAAAQRQITRALSLMGIKDETRSLGGVLLGAPPETLRKAYQEFLNLTGATDAPTVLEIATSAKAASIQGLFEITPTEVDATAMSRRRQDRCQAIMKLVYERCALLATSR